MSEMDESQPHMRTYLWTLWNIYLSIGILDEILCPHSHVFKGQQLHTVICEFLGSLWRAKKRCASHTLQEQGISCDAYHIVEVCGGSTGQLSIGVGCNA